MRSFEIKTKVFFGDQALDRLAEIPYNKVLIITDPFMAQSSMFNLVTDPLKRANKEFEIFKDVVPDPPIEKISEGVKKMLEYLLQSVEVQQLTHQNLSASLHCE